LDDRKKTKGKEMIRYAKCDFDIIVLCGIKKAESRKEWRIWKPITCLMAGH